jgi:hypothetical protein
MTAKNKRVIGVSATYKTERARDGGISSIGKNAPTAKTDDPSAVATGKKKAAPKKNVAARKKSRRKEEW